MKIYTRGGDKGQTQVYLKQVERVSKADQRLALYGDIDELNSHIGVLIAQTDNLEISTYLQGIQRSLFQLGFVISAESRLSEDQITQLETEIDRMNADLPPIAQFILPGGCLAAAQAHVCRTVCRRVERLLTAVANEHAIPATSQAYINRLSDYFFVVARFLNQSAGSQDQFL